MHLIYKICDYFSMENNGEIYGKKIIANSDAVITNTNTLI